MSAKEIITQLPRLSVAERAEVSQALTELAADQPDRMEPTVQQPRVAGLHEGNVLYIADDFDAPLPDSFWLGTVA